MNKILRDKYGEDLTTFDSFEKSRARKKILAFYQAHDPKLAADKTAMDKAVDEYHDKPQEVTRAVSAAALACPLLRPPTAARTPATHCRRSPAAIAAAHHASHQIRPRHRPGC